MKREGCPHPLLLPMGRRKHGYSLVFSFFYVEDQKTSAGFLGPPRLPTFRLNL